MYSAKRKIDDLYMNDLRAEVIKRKARKELYRELIITAILAVILMVLVYISPASGGIAKPYIVGSGETLWSIAKENYPNENTGEIVWEIRQLNSVSVDIQPGQVIYLPEVR